MIFTETTALRKILLMTKRLKIVQGGTSAGKTIAILLALIHKAQTNKLLTISVVSETVPHLKRGAIKDFLNIMEAQGYFTEDRWNRTDFIYTFETGSKIEFFSADSPDKVRGPRRDDLFINECNNVSFDTYTQLAIRTKGEIYLDFNPVSSFWVHEEILPKLDADFLVITYKDNESLPETIVKEIESRRENKQFWTVYGLGQLGQVEGKIYKDWKILDELPHEARLVRRGLDFGYTNDPTALVDIYRYNGGFIWDETLYQKGLSNKQIADIILNLPDPQTLIIADSAEPKSIDELKSYGLTVLPSTKGAGSIQQGIQYVQAQRISVTARSVNTIKEYRNYLWATDRNGKFLSPNVPNGGFDHAMDAGRYGMVNDTDEFALERKARQQENFIKNKNNFLTNSNR